MIAQVQAQIAQAAALERLAEILGGATNRIGTIEVQVVGRH